MTPTPAGCQAAMQVTPLGLCLNKQVPVDGSAMNLFMAHCLKRLIMCSDLDCHPSLFNRYPFEFDQQLVVHSHSNLHIYNRCLRLCSAWKRCKCFLAVAAIVMCILKLWGPCRFLGCQTTILPWGGDPCISSWILDIVWYVLWDWGGYGVNVWKSMRLII